MEDVCGPEEGGQFEDEEVLGGEEGSEEVVAGTGDDVAKLTTDREPLGESELHDEKISSEHQYGDLEPLFVSVQTTVSFYQESLHRVAFNTPTQNTSNICLSITKWTGRFGS